MPDKYDRVKCPFWAFADSTDKYSILNGCLYMRGSQCLSIETCPRKSDSFCGKRVNEYLIHRNLLISNKRFAEAKLRAAKSKIERENHV
jgi:hypothetical protein